MPTRIEEMVALSKTALVERQRQAPPDYRPPRNRRRHDLAQQNAARRAVAVALKRGTLKRAERCEKCERVDVQAHHHKGYAREHFLDVVWLCARHHQLLEHGGDERAQVD